MAPPLLLLGLNREMAGVLVSVVEHLCFIAGGVVFWWPVIDATAAHCRWRLSPMAKLLYLFIGTFPQDGVALALQFSRTPFYEFYRHVPRIVRALDPVTDQTVAGAVLMLFGKSSYCVGAVAMFLRWFGAEQRADAEAAAAVRQRLRQKLRRNTAGSAIIEWTVVSGNGRVSGQGGEKSVDHPNDRARLSNSLLCLTNREKPSSNRPNRHLMSVRACNPAEHVSKYKASGRKRPVGPGILAKERMRGTWG